MTMGAPPQVMVPTPDFSVAPPSYRREEVKTVYRVEDKWGSSMGVSRGATIGSGPQYGREGGNLKPYKRKDDSGAAFDDSGFALPEDFNGNISFKRRQQFMDLEDTTRIEEEVVKTDNKTGAKYTEHLIFERRHFFKGEEWKLDDAETCRVRKCEEREDKPVCGADGIKGFKEEWKR